MKVLPQWFIGIVMDNDDEDWNSLRSDVNQYLKKKTQEDDVLEEMKSILEKENYHALDLQGYENNRDFMRRLIKGMPFDDVALIWESFWDDDSNTVMLDIRFLVDIINDNCDKWTRENISFLLSPLKDQEKEIVNRNLKLGHD